MKHIFTYSRLEDTNRERHKQMEKDRASESDTEGRLQPSALRNMTQAGGGKDAK